MLLAAFARQLVEEQNLRSSAWPISASSRDVSDVIRLTVVGRLRGCARTTDRLRDNQDVKSRSWGNPAEMVLYVAGGWLALTRVIGIQKALNQESAESQRGEAAQGDEMQAQI